MRKLIRSFTIEPEFNDKLCSLAREKGLSVSEVVERMVLKEKISKELFAQAKEALDSSI